MNSLATVPNEDRCWCGWNKLRQCPNCDPSTSLADRLKLSCKHRQCRSYPRQNDPTNTIIHTVGCPTRLWVNIETMSSDDWSKLLCLAEYGAWSTAFPKAFDIFDEDPAIDPVEDTIREIVSSLPQNLQLIGKTLAFPGSTGMIPLSDSMVVELFRKKVVPPRSNKRTHPVTLDNL